MMRIAIFAFIVGILALPAVGQTTQPADKAAKPAPIDQAWPRAVESLAKALAKGDLAEAEPMFSPRAIVHGFDSQQTVEVGTLLQRFAKSTIVGQHAYVHPPLAMAADVAADFKNTASIDEKSKARFLVDDERDMKRCNRVAADWIIEQLGAQAGIPIGVIVLWTPRPAPVGSAAGETAIYDALFVLCRGEEVSPHEFKITAVVFGNPLPQLNP